MGAELFGIVKDIAVTGLAITTIVLLVVIILGLVKLFPIWRRIFSNLERTTAATAEVSENLSAVSQDVSQNLAKLVENSAQTSANIKESSEMLANLSRFNVGAVVQTFVEGNVKAIADLFRFLAERLTTFVDGLRNRSS